VRTRPLKQSPQVDLRCQPCVLQPSSSKGCAPFVSAMCLALRTTELGKPLLTTFSQTGHLHAPED